MKTITKKHYTTNVQTDRKRNTSRKTYQVLNAEVDRHCRKMKKLAESLTDNTVVQDCVLSSSSSDELSEIEVCGPLSRKKNYETVTQSNMLRYSSDQSSSSVMRFDIEDMTLGSENNVSISKNKIEEENVHILCDFDCSSEKGRKDAILDVADKGMLCYEDEYIDWSCILRKWAVENQVTLRTLGSLLKILKSIPMFCNLPLDPKTILRCGKRVEIENMGEGTYYNFGLKESIRKRILSGHIKQNMISLNINIDSVPLFKSIGTSFTPILCLVNDSGLPPFISAVYCGPGKPDIKMFLKDFAPELEELLHDGIDINEIKYKVVVKCFVCDAPARAYVKCIIGHSGCHGCERCIQKGKSVGRITFPEISAPLRTDESFACYVDQKHHHDISPLTDIGILMVSEFSLDYMHLVCLGVMRRLLLKWIKQKREYQFSSKCKRTVTNLLLAAVKVWRSDFSRKPRSLDEVKRWKATELRQFLLYFAPVVLKNYLPRLVYQHFLLLHVAITIFIREDLHKCMHSEAAETLRDFVKKGTSPELYGETFPVYNVHGLIHIVDDVKRFGVLDNVSAFIFKNELHRIKHLIRGRSKPLQQLVNRMTEIEINGFATAKARQDGIVESSLQRASPTAELQGGSNYSKYIHNGKTLTLRDGDNFAMLHDSTIIKVINFYKNPVSEWVIGKKFVQYTDLYSVPLKSSKLGIFVVEKLSDLPRKYPVKKIRYKCVAIPLEKRGAYAIYPLVN
ncbi:uncharacterized protein LOC113563100 [Ooceraea biroi]|uniref:uncharacterized protein LOC113563100 n=1 Tax=Ooceraea biroi TaxID=2015173 RepID=UPI000F084429|nr:uncharacterized protein LOC113563100 [Ooceraea biroi]